MTNLPLAALDQCGQRRFDVFRFVAPTVGVSSVVLAFYAPDTAHVIKFCGIAVMMTFMSIYVFALRGLPISQRPPAVITPFVAMLMAGFCFGTILCGAGIPGLFGFAVQTVPSLSAIAAFFYLRSPQGRERRAALVAQEC